MRKCWECSTLRPVFSAFDAPFDFFRACLLLTGGPFPGPFRLRFGMTFKATLDASSYPTLATGS